MKVEQVNFLGEAVDDEMADRLDLLIDTVVAKKARMFDCEPFSTGADREYIRAENCLR